MTENKINKEELRKEIIDHILSQGFKINPHLRPMDNTKEFYRGIHQKSRFDEINKHRNFLIKNTDIVKEYSISGNEIDPKKIDLELREVTINSLESKLFLWWNIVWWSLPYVRSIGRQMRFLLWDVYHDAPFGLIGLQSAPLCQSIRDEYLGIKKEDRDYWVNMSMYAQRVGALPPYNELLGGKMVAGALVSNEIRDRYKEKYENSTTIIKKRKLPADLMFITTTSAFGKSSMYDRLTYNGKKINEFLGYTEGYGTFHISEDLYKKMILILEKEGINTKRGYGTGPSRKLKLIDQSFKKLDLPKYTSHNIQRGFYLFPTVKNLKGVIHKNESPEWYNRQFYELGEYWMNRWCIPRSERNTRWKKFDCKEFFMRIENGLINYNQ